MTENSFEKPPKTELPSAEKYRQMGAELYEIIQKVESNTYTPNPKKELLLLKLKIIFEELLKARIEKAKLAESDLDETNLEVIDPERVIESAQAKYEKSGRTPKDDAKRWGSIFYALPLRAVDQATEAYELIQERGLGRSGKPLGFNEEKLKYPGKDFPEIRKFGASGEQSPIGKIKRGIENTSNN